MRGETASLEISLTDAQSERAPMLEKSAHKRGKETITCKDQEELTRIRERMSDQQLRAREVAGVLPQALKMSRAHGEELMRALQPAVEGSVRESISTNPKVFVDALHPILGPMVRRSIAES